MISTGFLLLWQLLMAPSLVFFDGRYQGGELLQKAT